MCNIEIGFFKYLSLTPVIETASFPQILAEN